MTIVTFIFGPLEKIIPTISGPALYLSRMTWKISIHKVACVSSVAYQMKFHEICQFWVLPKFHSFNFRKAIRRSVIQWDCRGTIFTFSEKIKVLSELWKSFRVDMIQKIFQKNRDKSLNWKTRRGWFIYS